MGLAVWRTDTNEEDLIATPRTDAFVDPWDWTLDGRSILVSSGLFPYLGKASLGLWTLAAAFRARGGVTAFLSNGVPEMMARVRAERRLDSYFDVVLVSYEVGFTKPDPRIYELCLTRLCVPASAALFVDDRAENVEGARRAGIHTVLFRGDASMDDVRAWAEA